MRFLLALYLLLVPGLALASSDVTLNSTVFVEKSVKDSSGKSRVVLEEPKVVLPGDKLIFVLSYQNKGSSAANNFVVTNPLSPAVAYQGTPHATAEVSVDGGRNWGTLSTLQIRESDGNLRSARMEDVTHIRWPMRQPVPPGAKGRVSFRGIVR
jgi:uncharacterized repeat protein (TIGR01451 family)